MKNKFSNPFHSALTGIFLEDWDGAKTDFTTNVKVSYNILQQNELCQFQRLELDNNIYELYPIGAVIVKDIGDIVSFIENNFIVSVKLTFEDQSVLDCNLTSVSYLNNAGSNTEKSMVCLHLSNSFYKFSQENSLVAQIGTKIPTLNSIHGFIKNYSTGVIDKIFANTAPSAGIIDDTDNYILYRPLNPDENKNEVPSDDAFQYMNYLSSMAVSPIWFNTVFSKGDKFNPRYFFWTEFGNYVNLKYIGEYPKEEYDNRKDVKEKTDGQNLRYAVYTGDIPEMELDDADGNRKLFKKIYFYRNDPTIQYISKNYYYTRIVPKFLDELTFSNTTNRDRIRGLSAASPTELQKLISSEMIRDLSYYNLDDGSKYNIEIVGTSGVLNGITAGADELRYDRHWGYFTEQTSLNESNNNTLISSEYGVGKVYSSLNYMGITGLMNYVDSPEMWKNMWDFTPVHPNTPYENTGITNPAQMNLQKLMNLRYAVTKGNTFTNENLELIKKVENQNFVMYNLCCIGEDPDGESFFAILTNYARDSARPLIWSYKWKELVYEGNSAAGGLSGYMSGSTYPYMILGGTGWFTGLRGSNTGPDDTWAINLNEAYHGVGETTNTAAVLRPGWVNDNLSPSFKYRPIGIVADATFSETSGSCSQIVKMNSISIEKLLQRSGKKVPEALAGKKLYYFEATNILDGSC